MTEKPITLLRFLFRDMRHLKLKSNSDREVRQLFPVVTT